MLDWYRDRTQHDFFRCCLCRRILTGDDERRGIPLGRICGCGHARYSPTNPVGLEWLHFNVLRYAFWVILGRCVLPSLERKLWRRNG
jgi:hypothetical protein